MNCPATAPIYLDNNATTALSQAALQTLCHLAPTALNVSSTHAYGREAMRLWRAALDPFAALFGCHPQQILFTSGATEALNTYIAHIGKSRPAARAISCVSEHPAVLEPLTRLQKAGWRVELLPVGSDGQIDLDQLISRLGPDVGLITLMAVNNETGVCHPIEAIASLAQSYQVPFLVDAVAAAGKVPIRLYPGISAMAISAHKFHGPVGVGALATAELSKIDPLIVGGGQQSGKRSGTYNLALLSAAAAALQEYLDQASSIAHQLRQLQESFEQRLEQSLGAQVNGRSPRAPNVSNLYFPGVDAESLLIQLDRLGILASAGSACQAGALELSHVLLAMHGPERARSSLRFSFSRMTRPEEIEIACTRIEQAVRAQRQLEV